MQQKSLSDLDFEMRFYERLVEKKPDFIEALSALGDLYTKKGLYEKGLNIDERLVQLRPEDSTVLYNLACSYSLLKNMDKAFETIKKAVRYGYDDFDHLLSDKDLINLRQDARFQEYFSLVQKRKFFKEKIIFNPLPMPLRKLFKPFTLFLILGYFSLSAPQRAMSFEPPRYDIQAAIDTDQKMITASEVITFTNNGPEPLKEIYFHIYPNRTYSTQEKDFLFRYASYFKVNPFPDGFPSSSFKIQSVSQEQNDLTFSIEGEDHTLLKILLEKALEPGQKTQVKINFQLDVPHAYGRLGWHEGIMALSHWYPVLSVYDKDGWHNHPFYPFHRPFFSEAAIYHVELVVPEKEKLIHSGVLQREEILADQKKKVIIDSESPIREFSLALSPNYQLYEQAWEGITIKTFYLPGQEKSAQKAFSFARDLMQFYTKRFGPYPYKVFNIAPVYLGYGGEQMSNLIYIDTRVFDLPGVLERYFDFLVAHETGHQWFYNLVGMDEYTQMWLEEGVHSYFILKYLQEKYGPHAEVLNFPEWSKGFKWLLPELTFDQTRDVRYKILARVGMDHPVVSNLESFKQPSSIFSLTYGKGARIVEMLEYIVGEETFNKIFSRVFKEYRYKNLDIKDFVRLCEEEAGQDLEWFFEPWLYTKNYFDVAVSGVEGNRIILEDKGGIAMPVEVDVEFADGTKETLVWDGRSDKEEITLENNLSVKRVELDPRGKLLDLDRTNNHWPREIFIKPVPIYFGLYDIPLFLPDDSYNVVVGPEIANGGLGVKASFQKPYDQIFYGGTDYEFSENIHHSRVGYELSNVFHSQAAFGFEIANQTDYDDGDEDLVSGKVFLRHELFPFAKGFFDINDHASLYIIRNQGLNKTQISGGSEDSRNVSYLKRDEAIVGANLHLDRSSPYPDPYKGFKLDTMLEHSGHFLGATQYFNRVAVDTAGYHSLDIENLPRVFKGTWALRFKYGLGYPNDKNLFQLGGIDGLRGFDRKEIRGSEAMMGNLEYRLPLKENIHAQFLDNILGIESVGAVAFVDAGQAWYKDFDESDLKKDAGVGLRLTVNIGSFLEKALVRADVAWPINEEEGDGHFWFGVGQAF